MRLLVFPLRQGGVFTAARCVIHPPVKVHRFGLSSTFIAFDIIRVVFAVSHDTHAGRQQKRHVVAWI